jgi:predicted metal-dependent phosphoesterase TrpH
MLINIAVASLILRETKEPVFMKADLHSHSYYSDGKLSPAQLLHRAEGNQVTHLAITDHDCTMALQELKNAKFELTLINGVEISCDWSGKEIHVVGLNFDLEDKQLKQLLATQQAKRKHRVTNIDQRLAELGHTGLIEYLDTLPCVSYTRSHVADFLVEKGICKNRQKAFKNFLSKKGRCYVASDWCSLSEAVTTINTAGGIAVLAHPGRYPLSKSKLESLVADFADCGGGALEVIYSNIDPHTQKRLIDLTKSYSLYASLGSDFHDSAARWMDLGRIASFNPDTQKNAIWLHPRWHSPIS